MDKEMDEKLDELLKEVFRVGYISAQQDETEQSQEDYAHDFELATKRAKQALQSLLKQAELRGRIKEIKLFDTLFPIAPSGERLNEYIENRLTELESQMEKEG